MGGAAYNFIVMSKLLSWTPPIFQSEELVILVEEMYCAKRLPSQQEVLALLRLAFRDIPDNIELIISQFNPYVFVDGTLLWLEEYRYHVGNYVVEFAASVHAVKVGKSCVVALFSHKGSC